jgi:predicted CopG family antitoxin
MARNIAVADDVYTTLKRLKRENESFSDVIRRLLGKNSLLQDLAGRRTFTREEWSHVQEAFEKQEVINQERRKRLLEKVEE